MKKALFPAFIFVFTAINLYIITNIFQSYEIFQGMGTPISVKMLFDTQSHFVATIDVDEDNEEELVFSCPWEVLQQVSIFEPFQKDYIFHYYGEIAVPHTYTFWGAEYDGKHKRHLFRFLEFEKGRLALRDVDNRMKPRGNPLPVVNSSLGLSNYKTIFLKPISVDLDGDGKDELLSLLLPNGEPSPGIVVCIEPGTGKLLWDYQTGTGLIDLECKDLDRDGKKEIILSTYATNRGVELNGTSDLYSYAIVLNADGALRWKNQLGSWGSYTYCLVNKIGDEAVLDIIAVAGEAPTRNKRSKISLLDQENGHHKVPYCQLQDIHFTKPMALQTRKGCRIYVGDSKGTIRIFDHRLTLLEEKEIKSNIPVYVMNASPKPGKWNDVFVYCQGQLMVYDLELKSRLFTHNFQPPYSTNEFVQAPLIIPLDTREGNHALVNSNQLYLISRSETSTLRNWIDSQLLLSLLTFLLFNILVTSFLYRWRVQKWGEALQTEPHTGIPSSIPMLHAIVHKIKSAVGTIGWTAEKVKRMTPPNSDAHQGSTDFSQLAGFLEEDAETLRLQTDNILKLVQIQKPVFRRSGLKPILQELVHHYQSVVGEHIQIIFQMETDIIMPLDEALLKEAIVNLLDNAVEAMADGGTIRISSVPEVSPGKKTPTQVHIEVSDTGCGIHEKDIQKLFIPFFSGKEQGKGTGIGLPICKQIIETHGGSIGVHSRKGFGTKIAITLPVRKKKSQEVPNSEK